MSEPMRRPGMTCIGVVPSGTRIEQLGCRVLCVYPSGEVVTPTLRDGLPHLQRVVLSADEKAAIGALRFSEHG